MGHWLVTVVGREQGWGRWDGRRAGRRNPQYCFWAPRTQARRKVFWYRVAHFVCFRSALISLMKPFFAPTARSRRSLIIILFLARDLSLGITPWLAFNFWHFFFNMTRFFTMEAVTFPLWSYSFGQGCSKDISLMLCSFYSWAGSDIVSYRCTLSL